MRRRAARNDWYWGGDETPPKIPWWRYVLGRV
jgi:hypothetical protein